MKKLIIILFIGTAPLMSFSQFAVVDVNAGTQLSILNKSLVRANAKIAALERKVQITNKELNKSNEYLRKIADLKEEEINAYKNAPDNRLVQYQKKNLFEAKQKIVLQIKQLLKNLSNLKYLSEQEKKSTKKRYAAMVLEVANIYKQTSSVLEINDKIIPANERQQLLENSLEVFERCISKMERENNQLILVSKRRKSRKELLGF